jgi:CBS domain-containing protein
MICPDCGHENIEGADLCEACQQPLDHLSEPQPATDIEDKLRERTLRDLVRSPDKPVCVTPRTRVGEVLDLLVANRIGCVLVVEGEKLAGIFSERDALLRLGGDAPKLDAPVADFMTPNPEALEIDAKIVFALHKMDVGHYRHVPVLEKGRVRGIISVRDILRYITEGSLGGAAGRVTPK